MHDCQNCASSCHACLCCAMPITVGADAEGARHQCHENPPSRPIEFQKLSRPIEEVTPFALHHRKGCIEGASSSRLVTRAGAMASKCAWEGTEHPPPGGIPLGIQDLRRLQQSE